MFLLGILSGFGAFNYRPLEGETGVHYDLNKISGKPIPKGELADPCVKSSPRSGCIRDKLRCGREGPAFNESNRGDWRCIE